MGVALAPMVQQKQAPSRYRRRLSSQTGSLFPALSKLLKEPIASLPKRERPVIPKRGSVELEFNQLKREHSEDKAAFAAKHPHAIKKHGSIGFARRPVELYVQIKETTRLLDDLKKAEKHKTRTDFLNRVKGNYAGRVDTDMTYTPVPLALEQVMLPPSAHRVIADCAACARRQGAAAVDEEACLRTAEDAVKVCYALSLCASSVELHHQAPGTASAPPLPPLRESEEAAQRRQQHISHADERLREAVANNVACSITIGQPRPELDLKYLSHTLVPGTSVEKKRREKSAEAAVQMLAFHLHEQWAIGQIARHVRFAPEEPTGRVASDSFKATKSALDNALGAKQTNPSLLPLFMLSPNRRKYHMNLAANLILTIYRVGYILDDMRHAHTDPADQNATSRNRPSHKVGRRSSYQRAKDKLGEVLPFLSQSLTTFRRRGSVGDADENNAPKYKNRAAKRNAQVELLVILSKVGALNCMKRQLEVDLTKRAMPRAYRLVQSRCRSWAVRARLAKAAAILVWMLRDCHPLVSSGSRFKELAQEVRHVAVIGQRGFRRKMAIRRARVIMLQKRIMLDQSMLIKEMEVELKGKYIKMEAEHLPIAKKNLAAMCRNSAGGAASSPRNTDEKAMSVAEKDARSRKEQGRAAARERIFPNGHNAGLLLGEKVRKCSPSCTQPPGLLLICVTMCRSKPSWRNACWSAAWRSCSSKG
jgi:hypothetical protein